MQDLRAYVAYYVPQLSGPAAVDAWHSLVEAGPAALPYVVAAFPATSDPAARLVLVQIIAAYRSEEAIPFFAACLQQTDTEVWKAALDGLVSLGGRGALDVLTAARDTAPPEKREWVSEAVDQIRETRGLG